MNNNQENFPSVHELKCPKCGNGELKILGTKGAMGKSIGISMAFGAIGNLVASSVSKDDYTIQPVKYKCCGCGKKFDTLPLNANPEELLDAPCTIHFTRLSSFVGMAVSQSVYLNGVKVATVGNGKSVDFQTFVKHNTVFVTDHNGVAFKGCYKFEAQSGGTENISFKKQFK